MPLEHTVPYHWLMQSLGLSTHPNQLEKRKKHYPQHFRQIDGKWFISVDYAQYITEVNKVNRYRALIKRKKCFAVVCPNCRHESLNVVCPECQTRKEVSYE